MTELRRPSDLAAMQLRPSQSQLSAGWLGVDSEARVAAAGVA